MSKSNFDTSQMDLFGKISSKRSLPVDYTPVRPDYFDVSSIFLAKGSISTPERKRFVERICELYPGIKIKECLQVPHNRVELGEENSLNLHKTGKRVLVFGELHDAVRFSKEEGNTCPNYWHFSLYGFCPFGCKYCYLAGTQGVKFSPTVKIYVNLPEMLQEIDNIATSQGKPTAFYLGKLQDSFALDPLTAYSTVLIPFFAQHPYARFRLLTKSTNIAHILNLRHHGHTILSWSINPPEICRLFEENVPRIEERLVAMCKVAAAGYPVRAVMMPIIPIENWQEIYTAFTKHLLDTVPVQRLTLGGICIYREARRLLEAKMGLTNCISIHIDNKVGNTGDGRSRYSKELRKKAYLLISEIVKKLRPDVELALCLEEESLLHDVGLQNSRGRCNCTL